MTVLLPAVVLIHFRTIKMRKRAFYNKRVNENNRTVTERIKNIGISNRCIAGFDDRLAFYTDQAMK